MTAQDANRELTDEEINIGETVGFKLGTRIGTIVNMEQRYVEGVEHMEWFYEVKWDIDENHFSRSSSSSADTGLL